MNVPGWVWVLAVIALVLVILVLLGHPLRIS